MIPQEITDKYGLLTLSEFIERYLGIYSSEEKATEAYYLTFLEVTDYEIVKGYESLMAEPLKFITNLTNLYTTLKDVVKWRVYSREEIEKLRN